jgi:hypothetical protein
MKVGSVWQRMAVTACDITIIEKQNEKRSSR